MFLFRVGLQFEEGHSAMIGTTTMRACMSEPARTKITKTIVKI